jgi:flagellar basal body-associated protein FliL
MPDYDDRATAPPSSATVIMIVVVSVIILIASGYMIYSYSSFRPSPAAQTTSTTAR